ncbi:PD-(D/E)XK motif protein [Acinetobacter towneri]|uniref:PD-(D/E)XK motif protein n=1 Tax=Acinetobacter towneri TaxID=202956 RepID=UPI0014369C9A|nr:PD-(D/E)XK motif protein [Acinetobacter towneri]MCA4814134.1 PD-(D/E)XK motif protein [Acinetobacter towneri]QIV93192.1 PD-(D/E)XK motif protein [Acinetobacter towneri]
MVIKLPWSELEIPLTSEFTTRRIGEDLKADIFIARDKENNISILVHHSQDLRKIFNKYRIDVGAVSSDYRASQTGFALQFKLQETNLIEYFDQFIQFVLKDLETIDDEIKIVEDFLLKLKNWKRFVSSSKYGRLSSEQVRGLLAEMNFLDMLLTAYPQDAAQILQSWYGPERLQHDFIFKDLAVEIKSISSSDKRSVKISSLHQLETNLAELYLHVTAILEAPENASDKTNLNKMVLCIKEKLKILNDPELKIIFEGKLLESNYIPDPYYDNTNYIIRKISDYIVLEDFPKVCSESMPNGILNVRYDLDLNSIDNYRVYGLVHKIGAAL